jgi:putative phage-type endonuclease
MRVEGLEQNTPEWLVQRVGMVTASRVCDVTTKLKSGKYSAAREKYLMDVICERLTGRAQDHFCTPAMERGIETEPRARAAYEIATGLDVEDGGFWIHDQIEWFGASPDGLVGPDGLFEAKCPTTAQHLCYLEEGVVPTDYRPQMLAQMSCTGRKWCDFVSFDDRLPSSLQLFIVRFEPKPEEITEIETEIRLFLEDALLKLGKLANCVKESVLADVLLAE